MQPVTATTADDDDDNDDNDNDTVPMTVPNRSRAYMHALQRTAAASRLCHQRRASQMYFMVSGLLGAPLLPSTSDVLPRPHVLRVHKAQLPRPFLVKRR